MAKLTQKELLKEGFTDLIKSAARKTAGVVAGAAGAVGGTALQAAKSLVTGDKNADLFGSIKAGAPSGFKKGYNLFNRSFTDRLKEFTNERGLWYKEHKGNNKNGAITVAELDYDNKGKPIEGAPISKPLLYNVKDGNIVEVGRRSLGQRQSQQGQGQAQQGQAQQGQNNTKPKFYEALRDWKINNIGPSAATVGINYQQAKEFIKSIGVQDADRVLTNANIQDRGSAIVSNAKLNNVLLTLKSRGVVSEKSQIYTLQESFNIIN